MTSTAHKRHRRLAYREGWHLDQTCSCEHPQPVNAGGNGYWIVPVVCAVCRKVARGEVKA